MKCHPKGPYIVGKIVDVVRTAGGLKLPESQLRNVTVMMRVERVGELVTRCKPGDLIVYLKMFHVFLRNGFHTAVVHNDEVVSVVELEGNEADTLQTEGEEHPDLSAPYDGENGSEPRAMLVPARAPVPPIIRGR